MKERPDRARRTKTEARIREAMTKLLSQGGMKGLTVSGVCREAGINRGTFYAHYLDKFDLVNKQIDAMVEDVRQILQSGDDGGDAPHDAGDCIPRDRVRRAIGYLYENRELIGAINDGGGDTDFQRHVKRACVDMIEECAARCEGLTLSYCGVPREYGREMLVSSMVAILWLWIERGCAEPPDQIARIVFLNKDVRPSDLLR